MTTGTNGPGRVVIKDRLPTWNLDSVYTGFESIQYREDKKRLKTGLSELLDWISTHGPATIDASDWLSRYVEQYNAVTDLYENLISYAYCRYSTATTDPEAGREINLLEEIALPFTDITVLFRNKLAEIPQIENVIADSDNLRDFQYFFLEELKLKEKQMSPAEENLASDLSRAGGNAWSRLQESVSSTLTTVWDDTNGEKKTAVQLRELAHSKDRSVRRKAYTFELALWEQAKIPLAAAINGVKGFSVILNGRRTYASPLERSVFQSRITKKSLDALLSVMEKSLPVFRRYLAAKAKLLDVEKLAFYDLFAPVVITEEQWSFERAHHFIVETFAAFSEKLASFADRAFKNGWIDALPREGKVGGAYCISFPLPKESRVLCNYNHDFSSVSTVAHELGHAYHHEVLKDHSAVHRDYPMTLAETASIFCQNLVIGEMLENAAGPARLGILEEFLQEGTQVIVDILSRFLFEQSLFKKREEAELSPEQLCSLMLEAQRKTYGEGLDKTQLHPYMWAVKSHYYSQDVGFYNFPYAFGMLFGLGLYRKYQQEGRGFIETYDSILAHTGKTSAVEITREAGFDIETPEFWQSGIDLFADQVTEYEKLSSDK